ncbi:MAG: ABC transporter permease [Armatimonadota bacterium]|nr:ABC transporter permease [Armatimonadota bacterium]MDR7423074.1 ABC transporter permease [Armatimonadota bacterium]MDR7453421.1 ABC transporter permease [Armatimonadota bacterium]MDR7456266.1 ABC transporter permease [Armatimonadota bacterium]MDR7495667.1 ABC transporter permease [Armatimonadota bacterium]
MGRYLLRRALAALLVIGGVVTIIFLIVRVIPGDPAAVLLGTHATAELIAEQRAKMGLDRPLAVQYALFLRQVAVGDWGRSYHEGRPAFAIVLERLPATLELAAAAIAATLVLSVLLGSLAARRIQSTADYAIGVLSLVGQAIPNFWLGLVLILVFARTLRWLPSFGRGTPWHLVLPAVTLSVQLIGVMTRLIRAGIVETAGQDYVRTARAKGLAEPAVMTRHVYRNMLIPVVTMLGLQLGSLVAGVVVVETVFAWPGLGRLIVTAINNRDYPVVQASVTFVAALFVGLNLLVDLTYAALDPRIRYT